VLAATRWYWTTLGCDRPTPAWTSSSTPTTGSLCQQIVPDQSPDRDGRPGEHAGSVALVSGVIGALVTLIALAFSVGPLGHVERYLPANQPEHADTS